MTLTEFLLARITEDQRHAEALAVTMNTDTFTTPAALANVGAIVNPARVLAECEAKRRIVRRSKAAEGAMADPGRIPDDGSYFIRMSNRDAWRLALADLALPYADHPDYDEAWRP